MNATNLQVLNAIGDATNDARASTGDKCINTEVRKGTLRIVRAVPQPGGSFAITPLTDYMPIADAVTHLRAM